MRAPRPAGRPHPVDFEAIFESSGRHDSRQFRPSSPQSREIITRGCFRPSLCQVSEPRYGPFPVKTRRAQDIVKAVANRAGLTKNVSPHVLRHTFATTALQKGISLPTVEKILGHNSLQTTAIYLNFTNVHIQEEFEWRKRDTAGDSGQSKMVNPSCVK